MLTENFASVEMMMKHNNKHSYTHETHKHEIFYHKMSISIISINLDEEGKNKYQKTIFHHQQQQQRQTKREEKNAGEEVINIYNLIIRF